MLDSWILHQLCWLVPFWGQLRCCLGLWNQSGCWSPYVGSFQPGTLLMTWWCGWCLAHMTYLIDTFPFYLAGPSLWSPAHCTDCASQRTERPRGRFRLKVSPTVKSDFRKPAGEWDGGLGLAWTLNKSIYFVWEGLGSSLILRAEMNVDLVECFCKS